MGFRDSAFYWYEGRYVTIDYMFRVALSRLSEKAPSRLEIRQRSLAGWSYKDIVNTPTKERTPAQQEQDVINAVLENHSIDALLAEAEHRRNNKSIPKKSIPKKLLKRRLTKRRV